MTQHASLRVSSSATSVDESAAFAWLLLLDFFLDDIVLNIFSKSQEIFPGIVPFVLEISRKFLKSIDNNSFNVGELVQVDFVLLELLYAVNHNHFSLRVFCLVKAGLSCIGGVHTADYAVEGNASHVRNGPLRGIMTHDVY
jgi:hypothetical protein